MINVSLQYTAARFTALAKATALCTPLCLSDYGISTIYWDLSAPSAECSKNNPYSTLIAKWQAERDLSPVEVGRLHSVLTDYPADEVRAELSEELRWIMGERKLAMITPLTFEDLRQARHAVESGLTPFVVPCVSQPS